LERNAGTISPAFALTRVARYLTKSANRLRAARLMREYVHQYVSLSLSSPMLWACLQLPELPIDAVRPDDCAREQAAVVMDGPLRSPRIVIANAAARSCGIRAGQSLAAARALHPGLL